MEPSTKNEAIGMLGRAKARLKAIKENSEATIQTVVTTAEVSGTAFLLEYLRGRNGEYDEETKHLQLQVAGVPVSLLIGVGGHIAGFTGVGGKYSYHLHNVASGGLAAYAAEQGLRMGQKNANESAQKENKALPHANVLGGQPRMMNGPGFVSPYASQMANPAYAR